MRRHLALSPDRISASNVYRGRFTPRSPESRFRVTRRSRLANTPAIMTSLRIDLWTIHSTSGLNRLSARPCNEKKRSRNLCGRTIPRCVRERLDPGGRPQVLETDAWPLGAAAIAEGREEAHGFLSAGERRSERSGLPHLPPAFDDDMHPAELSRVCAARRMERIATFFCQVCGANVL
jgi:hypothetical protein